MEQPKESNCHICFGQLSSLTNIYDQNFKHLLDLIYHLLGFQVHIRGGLFNICPTCEDKLVWIGEFKKQCEKSLQQFRNVECKKECIDLDHTESLDNQRENISHSSESDSDAPLSRPKRRKMVLKRACKSVKKTKVTMPVVNDVQSKRGGIKQYPTDEVLQAIDENTAYTTDAKYRTCVHCNYVAMVSRGLMYHMQSTHEDLFKNWCNNCNVQTDDLENHATIKKCIEIRCIFCDKQFLNRSLLSGHLQRHCHKIFNPDLENRLEVSNKAKNDLDENDENNLSNTEEDSDYTPQIDSDSDYGKNQKKSSKSRPKKPSRIKKIPPPLSKIRKQNRSDNSSIDKPKPSPGHEILQEIDNDILKPNSSKQFPQEEVLQAIAESTSYFTDVKNKTCVHCKWEAGNAKILSVHMKKKHAKFVGEWCYRCNEQTNNLNLHIRKTKCNRFRCKFCNKIFLQSCRLANHLKTHSHKSFIEQYKDINDVRRLKQFSASEVFKAIAEYESYMTELKNRKCIICDFEAPISSTLRLHMTLKHEDVFEKWCKHCNMQTDHLQKHMEDVKCQEQLCKFCNKIYRNVKYFVQHLRTHCKNYVHYKHDPNVASMLHDKSILKARTQFPANEVLQAISERTSYNTDVKFRSCNICDFQGRKRKALMLHMRFGHKESFDNWCSRCNIQTDNLQDHNDTVKCIEERCVLCNKVFLSIKTLIRHIKSHCRTIFKQSADDDYDFDWDSNQYSQFDDNNDPDQSDCVDKSDVVKSSIDSLNNSLKDDTSITNGKNKAHKKAEESGICGVAISEDDELDDVNSCIFTKDARFGPLKQFPKDAVYKAIMDSLKCFYTNRKCIVCSYLTLNSRCLGTHMSCHKEIKDKWCSLCNAVVGDVAKHWETHKSDLLKCTFCGRPFESPECLRDHLKRHCRSFAFDPKQKWFVCHNCPNSFPEEPQLEDHKCNGYDPKKINGAAVCTICKKRVHNLRLHMKQRHNPDRHKKGKEKKKERYRKLCPICGKTFLVSYLQAHMYSHTGEMPYKCSYCDKGFPLTSILRAHMKRHTGDKPFVCHICGKGFVTNCEHRSHMQIHEGSPVQCTICNKDFPRPAVLALHMKRHTGENPFSCFHCGISYHRKSLLLNHMKTHSDERPFKCSFCEKYFRDPKTLQQHENIHKGIKPYACSICSFSCTQPHALTCHMKQHPEDAPQADRPYKCLYCYRSFSTNAMLMSHTNHKHRENMT